MNMDERVKRINELYHLSQVRELTADEKAEQVRLRKEYVASIRGSIRAQLDNIDIQEKDGSITNLGEKVAKKREEAFDPDSKKGRKALLRKSYSEIRDGLDEDERKRASEIICDRIASYREYKKAGSICLFYPYRSEVDVLSLAKRALDDGKEVYFPKCELVDGVVSMRFYKITSFDVFEEGYKGIMEPAADRFRLECADKAADLMIVPGLVFDKEGYRIGYGKGFYDKYLSSEKPLHTIGVCYFAQICNEGIPYEENDIRVDVVVSEAGEFGDFM